MQLQVGFELCSSVPDRSRPLCEVWPSVKPDHIFHNLSFSFRPKWLALITNFDLSRLQTYQQQEFMSILHNIPSLSFVFNGLRRLVPSGVYPSNLPEESFPFCTPKEGAMCEISVSLGFYWRKPGILVTEIAKENITQVCRAFQIGPLRFSLFTRRRHAHVCVPTRH